jgi:AcrR family transcriptional regulator
MRVRIPTWAGAPGELGEAGVGVKKARRAEDLTYDTSGLHNAPQQKRSQELSLKILEGAERVLRREGLDAFTIAAVAAESGVSIGGIYGRFKNREEILGAIYKEVLSRMERHVEDHLNRPFASLEEIADVFAREIVTILEQLGDLLPVAGRNAQDGSTNLFERNIRQLLSEAVEPFRAEVKHPDPDHAVRLTVHLLLGSVGREITSRRSDIDRVMGWNTLREDLPHVARAVLTGRV